MPHRTHLAHKTGRGSKINIIKCQYILEFCVFRHLPVLKGWLNYISQIVKVSNCCSLIPSCQWALGGKCFFQPVQTANTPVQVSTTGIEVKVRTVASFIENIYMLPLKIPSGCHPRIFSLRILTQIHVTKSLQRPWVSHWGTPCLDDLL